MNRGMHFALIIVCCWLSGCATVKEAARGFAGVSTRVLEEKRKDAIRESFALDYDNCYTKVKDILKEKVAIKKIEEESSGGGSAYIYAEDAAKKMLAIYLSETDTTPVGIFFIPGGEGITMVEVSSPSIYAKEHIANRLFTGIKASLRPGEDKKANVKKEISN
ncbi:MAG: hypothetical protein PHR73_00435 [Candidatus Omnitrophica bacterium]|nr:hypothetical protein [Candidatus Omnitrophota bacterium]